MSNNLPFVPKGDSEVIEHFPLSTCTGFRCGGTARTAVFPHTQAALEDVLKAFTRTGKEYFVLGNGSNVLPPDGEVKQPIVFTKHTAAITVEENGFITAESGATLASLCKAAQEASLSGLEFAYGIPGTVGGAVYMNAGAYGGEISDVIVSADILLDGERIMLSKDGLTLGYRTSCLQQNCGAVVTARFKLTSGDPRQIETDMRNILNRRIEKQPLSLPSCGSAFKRPAGGYASALIDNCGLKGTSIGGAQVSEKHCGFIVNTGNATSSDVKALVRLVQKRVFEQTGIMLEPEIKLLGEQWT